MDNTALKYIVSGMSSAAYVGGMPAAFTAATTLSSLTGSTLAPTNLSGSLVALRIARHLAPFAYWNALTLQDTTAWTRSSASLLPQYCFEETLSDSAVPYTASTARSVHMLGAASYVRFEIAGPLAVSIETSNNEQELVLQIQLELLDTSASCARKRLSSQQSQSVFALSAVSNCMRTTAAVQLGNASLSLSVPSTSVSTTAFPNASSLVHVLSVSQHSSTPVAKFWWLALWLRVGGAIANASTSVAAASLSAFASNLSVTLGGDTGRGTYIVLVRVHVLYFGLSSSYF